MAGALFLEVGDFPFDPKAAYIRFDDTFHLADKLGHRKRWGSFFRDVGEKIHRMEGDVLNFEFQISKVLLGMGFPFCFPLADFELSFYIR